jgi:uncharacterized membrane protein YeaQ/YmgE (transglycosylase-associated protein family)
VDILIMLVVGGIVGWLASLVMKTSRQMGIVMNVIVGIVGSILGGWIFSLLGLLAYGPLGRLIGSVIGAMLLIAILRGMKVLR